MDHKPPKPLSNASRILTPAIIQLTLFIVFSFFIISAEAQLSGRSRLYQGVVADDNGEKFYIEYRVFYTDLPKNFNLGSPDKWYCYALTRYPEKKKKGTPKISRHFGYQDFDRYDGKLKEKDVEEDYSFLFYEKVTDSCRNAISEFGAIAILRNTIGNKYKRNRNRYDIGLWSLESPDSIVHKSRLNIEYRETLNGQKIEFPGRIGNSYQLKEALGDMRGKGIFSLLPNLHTIRLHHLGVHYANIFVKKGLATAA